MTGDEGAMVRPAFANVIVQWVVYDALSPTVQTPLLVGEGAADLFVGGRHVQGTWSRAACDARTLYWDESGREVLLEPGKTWIALFPANASLIFSMTNVRILCLHGCGKAFPHLIFSLAL